jgi:hypothetical protein
MEITAALKENWKENKVKLQNEVSSLKKSMTDYKEERKTEWKSFKTKFNDDMGKVEKTLKKLATIHKK